MPLYTLNRDFTLRSTSGVISFIKDEATHVPPFMEMEVVGIGAVAVDKPTPSLVPRDAPVADAPQGTEREEQILTAISLIVEKNDSKDFTSTGTPSVKAVEAILGFDVDRPEVTAGWAAYKASQV